MNVPDLVYVLCLLASMVCAALLVRSWRRTRARLLLWSALCFVLLAVNNLMAVLDVFVIHDVDLTFVRQGSALAAVGVLLYGFIWEVE
jgi:hypothetical protein